MDLEARARDLERKLARLIEAQHIVPNERWDKHAYGSAIRAALRSVYEEAVRDCERAAESIVYDKDVSEDDEYWLDDNRDDIHSHGTDIGSRRAANAIRSLCPTAFSEEG
jgi:hypothetical protein